MQKNAICLVALLLGITLIVVPTAAGIHSPLKFTPPQISSLRGSVSGIDAKNPATFQPFLATLQGMDLTPAPQPQLILPVYLGTNVHSGNLFSPGCAGGCCGCCC